MDESCRAIEDFVLRTIVMVWMCAIMESPCCFWFHAMIRFSIDWSYALVKQTTSCNSAIVGSASHVAGYEAVAK